MVNTIIDTKGLPKAQVLRALYNGARPVGLGFLHFIDEDMTVKQAEEILENSNPRDLYFDYLHGRCMKISLQEDNFFDSRFYDRDYGVGYAQKVIDKLKEELNK